MRAVLIPVKSFRQAKARLSEHLSDPAREQLARDLASRVVAAAKHLPVFIACDDGDVADWAVKAGAFVLWTPGLGLSGAVTASVAWLCGKDIALVIVAHSDLALVESFEGFGADNMVTIAPDRHLDGTNVVAVPSSSGFQFSYGPGSYQRHRHEAERLGMAYSVIHDWTFAADIDTPADLALVRTALLSHDPIPIENQP